METLRFQSGNANLTIVAKEIRGEISIGDSVSVNGICLTVTQLGANNFSATATEHTVKNTTLKNWELGKELNLELALRVGDRLGGHLVQGHIDGVGKIARISYKEGHTEMLLDVPQTLLTLLPVKGSVAVDGISLTIADKTSRGFRIMIIPHTLENTALRSLKPGGAVNIETDIFIRWLSERFPSSESDNISFWEGELGGIHRED